MPKLNPAFLAAIILMAAILLHNFNIDFLNDEENGIQFMRGNWSHALELSNNSNKTIFLTVYATWCGPCKKLKKESFSDSTVGAYYNKNFVNFTFDGEKGIGKSLMEKYNLTSFPSLLFIDKNGMIIKKKTGFLNPNELLKVGQTIGNKSTISVKLN